MSRISPGERPIAIVSSCGLNGEYWHGEAEKAIYGMPQIMKMLGRDDHGLVDINAMALNAAIKGSILADPEACFVMTMALPFGSTRALPTAQDINL